MEWDGGGESSCLFLTSISGPGDGSWLSSDIDQITAPCFAIKFDTVRPPTPSSLSSFYHKEAAQGKSLIGFGLNRGFSGACHYIIEKIF